MAGHTQCQCGDLASWASDPGVPYGFDVQSGKYYLRLSPAVAVADVYCHWCGATFPSNGPKACHVANADSWRSASKTLPCRLKS